MKHAAGVPGHQAELQAETADLHDRQLGVRAALQDHGAVLPGGDGTSDVTPVRRGAHQVHRRRRRAIARDEHFLLLHVDFYCGELETSGLISNFGAYKRLGFLLIFCLRWKQYETKIHLLNMAALLWKGMFCFVEGSNTFKHGSTVSLF